jgi:excinuclease ABC subunit C
MAINSSNLKLRLKATPALPGVYMLKDSSDGVIYVGKSSSLRTRLLNYFGSQNHLDPKIRQLVAKVEDFEFIVTDSETEALILENTLIKKEQPKYNARLKDGKTYPYLKIGLHEDFPQVYVTRNVVADGSRYFGPYPNASSVRTIMYLLKKLFPYRSCNKVITGNDARPCLEYYIDRCVAPCTGAATREEYRAVIDQVVLFLEGKTDAVVKNLRKNMTLAAERLEFERATSIRDQLRAIENVTQKQKMVTGSSESHDVIALAIEKEQALVQVFFVRYGKLVGRANFVMDGVDELDEPGIIADFLKQYYDAVSNIPPTLLLQYFPSDGDLIRTWLASKRGGSVNIRIPIRGEKKKLLLMVEENARQGLEQLNASIIAKRQSLELALEEIREALNLSEIPRRMECYDISNTSGTSPVGSMVVFENGRPKPSHYRRFKINGVVGIDDYAMMQEMLRRRFKRLMPGRSLEENIDQSGEIASGGQTANWGVVPDLVLIDGGKGHLGAALEVLLEFGLTDIPLASLAKQHEEIFVRDTPEPIILDRNSPAMFMVQRLRDEAHRFAITYHRQNRGKKSMESLIDLIPGIGPKRKKSLLRHFGSVKQIKEASIEDLVSAPGMTSRLANMLKSYL